MTEKKIHFLSIERFTSSNSEETDSDSGNEPAAKTERAFLVRNDIKYFQNDNTATTNNNNNNSKNNNNSNKKENYVLIDRRRSDTDALNSMSDVKLVRQKLLKYAHVKSQDSTETPADEKLNGNVTSSAPVENKRTLSLIHI